MAVRSTMAALISRVRSMINDQSGPNQVFSDQEIQDVLDAGRQDVVNSALIPKPTYTGATIQFLNYFSELGGWEDDYVVKQYLTTTVTPSSVEPIAGHFVFVQTTLPPLYITGKLHDVFRAAADLLERQAAKWVLSYNMTVDGQSLQRGQVTQALQSLAKTYRMQQRPRSISVVRSDLVSDGTGNGLSLSPTPIDYMSSGGGQ